MKFEQYNKAIDVLVEMFDMEEEKAINIVNAMCSVFELKPTETREEILLMLMGVLSND